jgi:hypothetical protein
MRLIGPMGAAGPKNLEVAANVINHSVSLNVGNGTSAWWNGTAAVYDVYVGDIAFQEGNSAAQFWHQPISTAPGLYASQFHSLNFYGFKHVFGTPASPAAFTQVNFTGHWTVNGVRDTAFTIGGSDNSLWADGIGNVGSVQTAPAPGTPLMILSGFSKSRVGFLYLTAGAGWAGLTLSGGEGTAFYSPVLEGTSAASHADRAALTVTSGTWVMHGANINFVDDASVNGVILQTGGRLTLYSPRYLRATAAAAAFPFLYQTGGTAFLFDAASLTSGEPIQWRKTDGTTIPVTPDDYQFAALNTVGAGRAVFIASGGTVPAGTPTHTIVVELGA